MLLAAWLHIAIPTSGTSLRTMLASCDAAHHDPMYRRPALVHSALLSLSNLSARRWCDDDCILEIDFVAYPCLASTKTLSYSIGKTWREVYPSLSSSLDQGVALVWRNLHLLSSLSSPSNWSLATFPSVSDLFDSRFNPGNRRPPLRLEKKRLERAGYCSIRREVPYTRVRQDQSEPSR